MEPNKTIAILGARGRCGGATMEAFHAAGWSVRAVVRPGSGWRPPWPEVEVREADGMVADELSPALRGCKVVFNGLNPPYWEWSEKAIPLAQSVIGAAVSAGVETHLFPGNVYNYGESIPEHCQPGMSFAPGPVRKARLRVEMERIFEEASTRVQTIVLRAGDFYGYGWGSWMDLVVAKRLREGIMTYPGPMNVKHAWAFLPDLAATFVAIAERRAELSGYSERLFAGHALTGQELQDAFESVLARRLRVTSVPWFWMRLARPFSPMLR
ncbi:MAG: NmrA family NAD(P)-binding protein, partial [Myxococcota bacterium]